MKKIVMHLNNLQKGAELNYLFSLKILLWFWTTFIYLFIYFFLNGQAQNDHFISFTV